MILTVLFAIEKLWVLLGKGFLVLDLSLLTTLKYFYINHGDQRASQLITTNVLVRCFRFIGIPMLSVYGHWNIFCNFYFSVGTDFKRQNQSPR